MSLLKVIVNGQTFIVDAPSKAAAKAYGKFKVDVKVESVEAADLIGLDVAAIPKIEAKAKAKPAATAEGGEAQAEGSGEAQA